MELEAQELHYATEDFHFHLQALLHRQGVFQVLQHTLPANPEMFLDAQRALIAVHVEFAHAHQRLLEAHAACFHASSRFGPRLMSSVTSPIRVVPETPERRIQSPPEIPRESGLSTPPRSRARRELFPPRWEDEELECEEELEDSEELFQAIDRERFQHAELVNAVDVEDHL